MAFKSILSPYIKRSWFNMSIHTHKTQSRSKVATNWFNSLPANPDMYIELKGRPIPYAAPMKGLRGFYNPRSKEKLTTRWNIAAAKQGEPLWDCPISVYYVFVFEPPKYVSIKKKLELIDNLTLHEKKPDIDNLEKFYNDCLKGIVVKDDNKIACGGKIKIYGTQDKVQIYLYKHME